MKPRPSENAYVYMTINSIYTLYINRCVASLPIKAVSSSPSSQLTIIMKVLVIGGSRNIGYYAAQRFLSEDCLFLVATSDIERLGIDII